MDSPDHAIADGFLQLTKARAREERARNCRVTIADFEKLLLLFNAWDRPIKIVVPKHVFVALWLDLMRRPVFEPAPWGFIQLYGVTIEQEKE